MRKFKKTIKFRFWDTRSKEWVQSQDWMPSYPNFNVNEIFEFAKKDGIVAQQYTGLKDKNGREIYEGDILGYPESLDDKTLSEVRWAKAYSGYQWCEFRIQDINGNNIQDAQPHDYYGGISQNDYRIVVGNIFEGVDK